MPSHCSTDCDGVEYEIKKITVSDEEYKKIKETLGKIRFEEKEKRKGELEKSLESIQGSINQATSQLEDLKNQYNKLSKEYEQFNR